MKVDSLLRSARVTALTAFMTLGSVFMAVDAAAQGTPEASPPAGAMASPVGVQGTPIDDLGCWTSEPDSSKMGYAQYPGPPEMKIDESKTYIATIEIP